MKSKEYGLNLTPAKEFIKKPSQIARFMGQHGAHLGPAGPRWAPCWPHEPCYQGSTILWLDVQPGHWICVAFSNTDVNLVTLVIHEAGKWIKISNNYLGNFKLHCRPQAISCCSKQSGLWNRPISQIRAPPGGLSRTSGKLWQDYSNCYMFWT